MELRVAEKIYDKVMSSKLIELKKALITTGIRYARIHVDWSLVNLEERLDIEEERTHAHNAFISACDVLARNMGKAGEDNTWRIQLGDDRKIIGDFACLLHAVIGIKAR
jgi:hypothetical protein